MWNRYYTKAYQYFSMTCSEYWASQLACDYAEFICFGKKRKRGVMVLGDSYLYQAW